jgi:WD40 repeat protein
VVALDPTGTIAITGSGDGTIRVGLATGEAPHLLFGHKGAVVAIDVSRDGRWIASGGADGTVRVWPMPDVSKPPLHTLPHDQLLAKLMSLTNLRVVADKNSPGGYKLELSAFPGWERVPTW